MAHFYPGLPPLRSLSPIEIAGYITWRHEALTQKKDGDDPK